MCWESAQHVRVCLQHDASGLRARVVQSTSTHTVLCLYDVCTQDTRDDAECFNHNQRKAWPTHMQTHTHTRTQTRTARHP